MIISNHPIVQAGLRHLLPTSLDQAAVTTFDSVPAAIEGARRANFAAAILDVFFLGPSARIAMRDFRLRCPKIPMLIFSRLLEGRFALRLLREGAAGYITEAYVQSELGKALQTVAAGRKYIDPALAEWMLVERENVNRIAPRTALSAREHALLELISHGVRLSDIAARLGIGVKTAQTYRDRIRRKTGLHSDAALTRFAIEEGIGESMSAPLSHYQGATR